MYVIHNYSLAVVMCIVTMLCWGSWANTQKLAGREWRFELFYWDYVIGVVILSLIAAFTVGSIGDEGRPFLEDIGQATNDNLLSAFVGGVIFNLANILLVAAIAVAGMAVAFPVGIGIALVLGVVVNYIGEPVGNVFILLAGVALVMIAIILDAKAYKRLSGDDTGLNKKGLYLSVVAGVLMGVFYRFVADSMSVDFTNLEPGKMGPYAAVVVFASGVVASSFLFNTYFMKRPIIGAPVTFGKYFSGSLAIHSVGVLGGIIWCIGMSLSIIASGEAGFAISYGLGQGATMVAAFWGVVIWKEFDGAPAGTNKLITWMFVFFILGLGLIVAARLY